MDIFEHVNDNSFTFYSLIQYINDNFIGLLLLVLTFFIIYFVDYISQINAILFSMPSAIPGMPTTNNIFTAKIIKEKKFKKR